MGKKGTGKRGEQGSREVGKQGKKFIFKWRYREGRKHGSREEEKIESGQERN